MAVVPNDYGIINHFVTIAYSIQFGNMLYRFVI